MLVVMLTCLATLVACLQSPIEHAGGLQNGQLGLLDIQRVEPAPIVDICRKYAKGYGTMSTSSKSRVNLSELNRCGTHGSGTEKEDTTRRSDTNAGHVRAQQTSSYPRAKNLRMHMDTGSLKLSLCNDLPFPSSRGFSLTPPPPSYDVVPCRPDFADDNTNNNQGSTAPTAVFTYRFDRDTSLTGEGKVSLHLSTTGDPLKLHDTSLSLRLTRICSWLTHGRALLSTSFDKLSSPFSATPIRPEFICAQGEGEEMVISTETVLTVEDKKRRIVRLDGTFEIVVPMVFLRGDELQLQILGGIDERTGSQVIHSGEGVDSLVVFGS